MAEPIRFGDYLQEVGVRHRQVSYVDLQAVSTPGERIRLRPAQVLTILRPYVGPRFFDQVRSVAPLAAYLALFQALVLETPVQDAVRVSIALVAVMVGLMLFMEGLKIGLMPLGARMGETLPTHSPLPVVLTVVFLLGVGTTFAEPAIGALKAAGAIVSPAEAPVLYQLLNHHAGALVLVVGAGVGLAAVLGTLRFVYGWSLKPLIYLSVIPCLLLSAYCARDPLLAPIVGMAWDSGAVTTGPITVPLVLALGIGVAHAVGHGSSGLPGFGIVTLASLFPVLGVLVLSLLIDPTGAAAAASAAAAGWWTRSPWVDVIGAFRAIVPLVVFLLLVIRGPLKRELAHPWVIAYGIALTLGGMIVFNLGLSFGLAELGSQSGGALPAAFTTLAEPALNALGITVEELTNGAFSRLLLLNAVALGVGCGIALGVAMIVLGLSLSTILIPGYLILLVLTFFSSEEFVNVAWDSAAVTTGPVTVPLVLAMGLGLGRAVQAGNGFGVVALASLFPVGSVLLCGLYINWTARRRPLV